MSFLKDMAAFMLARKKFWLVPALVLMTIFGGLIVLTKGSVVAPFIYTCSRRMIPKSGNRFSDQIMRKRT